MTKTAEKAGNAVEQMFEAGVHYGYSKSRRHPSVKAHIYATKNQTDIINLEHTEEMLKNASKFLEDLANAGKTILIVGTKPESRTVVKNMAEKMSMPYVVARWIGGTLTNFTEIKKRIIELETLTKEKADGSWSKYTKKEASDLNKKMKNLDEYYGGLLGVKKLPDALFIIDPREEHTALAEAIQSGIPTVALANSDTNIKNVTYPVLGNDSSIKSIKYVTEILAELWQSASLNKKA